MIEEEESRSGRIELVWQTLIAIPVLALVLYAAYALFYPHTSIKNGPRIQDFNALRQLGIEIMHWQGDTNHALPEHVEELGPSLLARLGRRTNNLIYLGPRGQKYGIVAMEKIEAVRRSRNHWTSDRLAVLKTDFSVDFVPTNALPVELLDAASGHKRQ